MPRIMPRYVEGKEGSAFCFDGLRLCLVNILLMKPLYS
jgi:hypothetical protein